MHPNIIEYYKTQKIEKELTDEEIIQYFEDQLKKQIPPKQHIQIITIHKQKIPIILIETNEAETTTIGTQGAVVIHKTKKDPRTLRLIILEHHDQILKEYQKTQHKKITLRTPEEYHEIVNKYIQQWQEKLQLNPVQINHKYLKPNKLGFATKHNSITLNQYLRYMEEETIKYVIYHELCHIYIYKHHKTLSHKKEFKEILYKEYTPQQEEKIIKN